MVQSTASHETNGCEPTSGNVKTMQTCMNIPKRVQQTCRVAWGIKDSGMQMQLTMAMNVSYTPQPSTIEQASMIKLFWTCL